MAEPTSIVTTTAGSIAAIVSAIGAVAVAILHFLRRRVDKRERGAVKSVVDQTHSSFAEFAGEIRTELHKLNETMHTFAIRLERVDTSVNARLDRLESEVREFGEVHTLLREVSTKAEVARVQIENLTREVEALRTKKAD